VLRKKEQDTDLRAGIGDALSLQEHLFGRLLEVRGPLLVQLLQSGRRLRDLDSAVVLRPLVVLIPTVSHALLLLPVHQDVAAVGLLGSLRRLLVLTIYVQLRVVAVRQDLAWGCGAVQANVRVARMDGHHFGVGGRVLRTSMSIIENEALSLLLKARCLILVVQSILTLSILRRSITRVLDRRSGARIREIGRGVPGISQSLPIHFWPLSYYVEHAILEGLLVFREEVLLPGIVADVRVQVVPLEALLEEAEAILVIGLLLKLQTSAIYHVVVKLLRNSFAEILETCF
jgi:hypothetical protein